MDPITRSLNSTIGCYIDGGSRDLPFYASLATYLTLTSCSQFCYQQRFRYAGAQAGGQCFCGNKYGKYGQAALTDCDYNCPGDPTQSTKCGGYWRNTIMYTGFGSTRLTLLYRDIRLTNVSSNCFRGYSNLRCASRCLRGDSNGCMALQYDANSFQCCLIVERQSQLIGTTYSAGVSIWVVV